MIKNKDKMQHSSDDENNTIEHEGSGKLNNVMNKIPADAGKRLKHYLLPGMSTTLQPLDDITELNDFPNVTISMPIPIHIAPKHSEGVDLCHRRTIAHSLYMGRLVYARTCFRTAEKKRAIRAAEKKNIYPMPLFNMAERLEAHPDPFFNSSFDYYYSGGNLCALPNSAYVVHTGGDELKDIHISHLPITDDDIAESPMQTVHQMKAGHTSSEIFQIIPFHHETKQNCFATRQRNSITLYSFSSDDNLAQELLQFNSTNTPFISFAQPNGDSNKFVTTNMKQQLRVFDINRSETSSVYKLGDMRWNMIKAWNEHINIYANNKAIYSLDMRTAPDAWLKTKCSFGNDEQDCENIANLVLSNFEHQFYVGASHTLYCLDARCWRSTFGVGRRSTIARWTHQLQYPPLLMVAFQHADNSGDEFIALSSPIADDVRICELRRTAIHNNDAADEANYMYKTHTLPFQPPTLSEAYANARLHGKCLRSDVSDLAERIQRSTTGLTMLAQQEAQTHKQKSGRRRQLLLISNSIGDVFAHEIGKRKSQDHLPRTSAFTDKVMHKYEETICRLPQPALNYTEVHSLKAMSKIFRCEKLNMFAEKEDCDDPTKIELKHLKRNSLGRWQKSVRTLSSYKDALAQDLLSIWDVEDYLDDHKIELIQLKEEQHMIPNADTLVRGWMEANDVTAPMTSIPLNVINDTKYSIGQLNESLDTQEFMAMANERLQSTQIVNEGIESRERMELDSSMLNISTERNNTFDGTPSKGLKTRKKRKSYVKGF